MIYQQASEAVQAQSAPIPQPQQQLPEPSVEDRLPEPRLSSHEFARNLIWTFEDLRMLIGKVLQTGA